MRHFSASELRPAYGIVEASQYLRLAPAKTKRWAELFAAGDLDVFPLSFVNLSQIHLLKAIRLDHRIPMQRVRRALGELQSRSGSAYPLLQQDLHTDGLDLFLQDDNSIINLSHSAQRVFREHFDLYAKRIDLSDRVAKLYPFVRDTALRDAPQAVVIRPDVGFGRPTVSGTGILTETVANRFQGGDSIADLMEEYRLTALQMEETLRWERDARVAA